MQLNVTIEEYTVTQDDIGTLTVKRHGEPWKDYTGNGLICAMAHEIEKLREKIEKLKTPKANP